MGYPSSNMQISSKKKKNSTRSHQKPVFDTPKLSSTTKEKKEKAASQHRTLFLFPISDPSHRLNFATGLEVIDLLSWR